MGNVSADTPLAIIAGHSHATCLGVPLLTDDGSSRLVPLTNGDARFLAFTGAFPRPASFWPELAVAAVGYALPVILFWQGNQHVSDFLLCPAQPIDFVLHEESDLPINPAAEIVPDLAVHDRLALGMLALDEAIATLRAGGVRRVIIGGTPPPKGDVEMLRNAITLEAYHFGVIAAQLGFRLEEIPIAEPLLMYKMWRVVQRHLEAAAGRQSAEFLRVPTDAQRDRFLREEFAASDATHANALYGARMLDHLAVHLRSQQA